MPVRSVKRAVKSVRKKKKVTYSLGLGTKMQQMPSKKVLDDAVKSINRQRRSNIYAVGAGLAGGGIVTHGYVKRKRQRKRR